MLAEFDGEGEYDLYESREPYPMHCKYCKRGELHWESTGQGWRLFTQRGRMHSCKKGREARGKNNPSPIEIIIDNDSLPF